MSVVVWIHPRDLDPPHGLDLVHGSDLHRCLALFEAFERDGFDRQRPALIAYPQSGRIQLLSGTHRHQAALWADLALPVVFWLRSSIEEAFGNLDHWLEVMREIPVVTLETWTRADLYQAGRAKAPHDQIAPGKASGLAP